MFTLILTLPLVFILEIYEVKGKHALVLLVTYSLAFSILINLVLAR
jgi:hypothetical protein